MKMKKYNTFINEHINDSIESEIRNILEWALSAEMEYELNGDKYPVIEKESKDEAVFHIMKLLKEKGLV